MNICGYGLLGQLCQEPKVNFWCVAHEHPRWSVCVNGHEANHACPAPMPGGSRCLLPLCTECVHTEDGNHQHVDEIPSVLRGSPRHPQVQQGREVMLADFAQVAAEEVSACVSDGAIVLGEHVDPDAVAARIVKAMERRALAVLLMGSAVTR